MTSRPSALAAVLSLLLVLSAPPARSAALAVHPAGGAQDSLRLPTVDVEPTGPATDLGAVMLSGDGGWATLDRNVAAELAAHGVPVVGLDVRKYLWTRRTPEQAAEALERMIASGEQRWGRRRWILVGYSHGADILPFLVNRTSEATRSRVAAVALLGIGHGADFDFRLVDVFREGPSRHALPTLPEARRLRGMRVLCVRGVDEKASLCPELAPDVATVVTLPGGHHFDGDYREIARRILDFAR